MANLQKVIKLTQAQYDTLAAGGTVGQYTGLNDNYIYLVKDTNTYATEDYVDAAIEDLATVATTGSYNDLLNKPTIPTKTSDLTNDSGFVTTDTKNTAGSTNDTSLLYLIGAKTQAANPQTYSRNNTYINANGVLVNTTGFSSYSYAASTGSGLLYVAADGLRYTGSSGSTSLSLTSSTHGGLTLGLTAPAGSAAQANNVYIQKTKGATTSSFYLYFPNVGTSSAPKTLATTDNFSASSSAVSGATEAKSIQINGTNWNLPSGGGGGAEVVSAEFIPAGYTVTITIANSGSASAWNFTKVYDIAYPDTSSSDHLIGEFSSANGVLNVVTETGIVDIEFDGGLIIISPEPTVTGDITIDAGLNSHYRLNVTGNGTITFDGNIDWDD